MFHVKKYTNTLTLENKIPIRTYIWTHSELDELLADLDKKEYLISEFCFQNGWFFDKQILVGIEKREYKLRFDVYNL